MQLPIDKPYLVCPIGYNAQKKRLEFRENGVLLYALQLPLDFRHPDYAVTIPVGRFLGRTITLETTPAMDLSLTLTDKPIRSREGAFRPRFHFSASRGWINDPNGLCTVGDTYHLFYQHNPASHVWDNMHWGHAVSRDLLHWEERDPALFPDETGAMFSGCAFLDQENRSGLGRDGEPPLLLFYTAFGSTAAQCLAYSLDGGNSFQKYAGNPILPGCVPGNRDPKVIRHEASDRYIMALYLDKHDYGLFASRNLLDWELLQILTLDDDTECPDFYPLPLDGDASRQKWIFSGASDRYLVGSFDGYAFRAEQPAARLHYGNASYAAQTWHNLREGDDRRLRLAWNHSPLPPAPFGGSLNIPCEMTLRTIDGAMRLCCRPVSELASLHREIRREGKPTLPFSLRLEEQGYDVSLVLSFESEGWIELSVFGLTLRADFGARTLTCLDCSAPLCAREGQARLRVLFDTTGAEIFLDQGQAFLSVGRLLDYNLDELTLTGRRAVVDDLQIAAIAPL